MIRTREDLRYYLGEDARVYGKDSHFTLKGWLLGLFFPDRNYAFMVCLRHLEYHVNNMGGGNLYHRLMSYYYHRRHARLWAATGIELHPNVAAPGLHIVHGKVVINAKAHIGKNCKIYSDVTIGWQGRRDRPGAPVIGERVFIASGAKLIGNIHIADDVVIGANAVVTRDITEPGTTWGGIPARKISDGNSAPYLLLPESKTKEI